MKEGVISFSGIPPRGKEVARVKFPKESNRPIFPRIPEGVDITGVDIGIEMGAETAALIPSKTDEKDTKDGVAIEG